MVTDSNASPDHRGDGIDSEDVAEPRGEKNCCICRQVKPLELVQRSGATTNPPCANRRAAIHEPTQNRNDPAHCFYTCPEEQWPLSRSCHCWRIKRFAEKVGPMRRSLADQKAQHASTANRLRRWSARANASRGLARAPLPVPRCCLFGLFESAIQPHRAGAVVFAVVTESTKDDVEVGPELECRDQFRLPNAFDCRSKPINAFAGCLTQIRAGHRSPEWP